MAQLLVVPHSDSRRHVQRIGQLCIRHLGQRSRQRIKTILVLTAARLGQHTPAHPMARRGTANNVFGTRQVCRTVPPHSIAQGGRKPRFHYLRQHIPPRTLPRCNAIIPDRCLELGQAAQDKDFQCRQAMGPRHTLCQGIAVGHRRKLPRLEHRSGAQRQRAMEATRCSQI